MLAESVVKQGSPNLLTRSTAAMKHGALKNWKKLRAVLYIVGIGCYLPQCYLKRFSQYSEDLHFLSFFYRTVCFAAPSLLWGRKDEWFKAAINMC